MRDSIYQTEHRNLKDSGYQRHRQNLSSINGATQEGRVSLSGPENGKLRVRKVVTRSRARATGKFPSWKMGRMIQFKSQHELKIYRLFDADPRVIAFSEQPLTIHYWLDGAERKHHPDVLVVFNTHKELWELKPELKASDPEVVARVQFLSAELLPLIGYSYRVVVPDKFATATHHSNAITILKYGRTPISDIDRERVRRILASVGTITWGAVEKGALGQNGRRLVCRLILEGVLSFDFRQPLHSETAFMWVADATQGRA